MDRFGPLVCPILVGRDDVLARADARLAAAKSGSGGVVFLAGEAGIGKTRLLGAIERRAASLGFAVVQGATFPRDMEVAGGLFLDLARSMVRTEAVRIEGQIITERLAAADLGDSGDAHRRHRILLLDIVDQLAGMADRGPILIALEDLHWADELTLEIIDVLARRLASLPMIVVASYRSDELYPRVPMRDWRAQLLRGRLAEELAIERLTFEQTATMTTLILNSGLPAPLELVRAILERSDGVPLHVEELLGVVRAAANLRGDAVRSVDIPDTLEDAVLRRAARLSPEAKRVAESAAVIGRSFDVGLLSAVVDQPPELLDAPLAELESQFFVVRSRESGGLDFRHALIRDALYAAVPPVLRQRLHGRVADAATGSAFGAAFLSGHLEEAGRASEAFGLAMAGGRSAATLSAHLEAKGLFERALRNAPADLAAADRAAVLSELAAEAAATDENAAADRYYSQARELLLEQGDSVGAAALVPAAVAVRHLLGDDLEMRADLLRHALSEVEAQPDSPDAGLARARILAGLSAAYMLDRRLEESISFGEMGRAAAIQAADERTELNVAATVGSCLVFAGRMDEGWSLLEAAAKRARADHLESDAARAYRMIGTSASVLLEYDMAERWLTLGIEFAERHELWNDRHYMAAHFAHVGWATGDWSAAGHVASRALADGRGGMTTRITALHVLGYLALGAGDLGRAVDLLEEARRLGEAMAELQRYSPALWGLAEAALLNGDPAAAAAWCERGRAASAGVNDTAYLFPFLVTGTRAKLGLGDPAGAEAWFDALAPALEARSIPGTLVSIDHARGLIELARGRTGKARVSLESARAGWLSRRRCWEGTWSTLDLATCLSRSNRPTAARRLAEEARELALSMGAAPLVERADTVLRRLGDRTPDGEEWAPLSAREYEVARLIAEGRTNAEIARIIVVAPKTVAAHVEHILTKLNMGRRTEVAAWAMRAERDHASPSNAVATRPQPAHPGHDVREHARLRGLAGSRPVDLT